MGTEGSPTMGHPTLSSSAIIGPDGRILAQADAEAGEQLIPADLDLSLVTKTKIFADASGHCEFENLCCDLCKIGAEADSMGCRQSA